jgi:hypothetical protein
MINTSDQLQLLVHEEPLHGAICSAIDTAIELLEPQNAGVRWQKNMKVVGFSRFFGKQNRKLNVQLDGPFLAAALHLCLADSQKTGTGESRKTLQSYLKSTSISAPAWTGIRRGMKVMLVELWRQRSVLLPTLFSPGTHFSMDRFEHELLTWIKSFDPSSSTPAGSQGKSVGHRLYYYGPRLLMAADWQRPEDVTLNELASLHDAQNRYSRGESKVVIAGGTFLPFSLFTAQLLSSFPTRVTFTTQDLARYSKWALTKSEDKPTFEKFEVVRRRKRRLVRPPSLPRVAKMRVDHAALVAQATQVNTHDALLNVWRDLRMLRRQSVDWRVVDLPSYPGREHVDLTAVAPHWIETFRAYLHHRTHVKQYRSEDDVVSSLNLLADYLFFYLPWWRQLYSAGKTGLPTSPREFSRYSFVARHTDVLIDELPRPLLQLIELRRPKKESASVTIHQLTNYFEFVSTQFAEDERIAGRGYSSPINDDFDVPRIKKKSKTNKEVIPKQLYGHLLFYCYAVEEFGRHLEDMAVKGELPLERGDLRSLQRFTCSKFGHVPVLRYRGQEIVVQHVPNVFIWADRERKDGERTETAYMPHLSALRLLIASLETGLRCQSVQWLDRATWDSLNHGSPADSPTFALLVNTDKTREEPWKTYVVRRVRALLQREQTFQESFTDVDEFAPVAYEGSEHAPFGLIQPLFRAAKSGKPVGDQAYDNAWKFLMIDFESFFRETTGERHVSMCRMTKVLDAEGNPVVRFLGITETVPYCPVRIRAIHTPHACRATFATNRQGVLELSDVADLLGHQSQVVTAHYTKPSGEDLQERLRKSDAAAVAEYTMFDSSSVVHIRADRPESALVRSFSKDPEGTVQRFKFMPSIALWSTEEAAEGEDTGLQLLKQGPMSRIRFRETHICPVGEECPANIIEQIGAPRRCGACPLAMKCIDHLPAIAAKRNQLVERIKYLHRRRASMETAGEPVAALDEIWDHLELDVNELLGWQLSEEILTTLRKESAEDESASTVLHVDRPEIVRRHLERVTRTCNSTELILQRIADSNAYPTLSTPEVQAAAARIKRKLLAGSGVEQMESWIDDLEDVRSAAKMLAVLMKTSGMSVSQAAALVNEPAAAPSAEALLLTRSEHGS